MTLNYPTFKYKPNLKKRVLATFYDYGLFFLATSIYVGFFGHDNDEGGRTVSGLLTLPIIIFWFIYFVIIEGFYGATFGHQAFNLKVLKLNRMNIGFSQAFKRHLIDPIDIFIYGIPAIIAIKNSDKHQRLGDMWAKTIIVDTTDREQYSE